MDGLAPFGRPLSLSGAEYEIKLCFGETSSSTTMSSARGIISSLFITAFSSVGDGVVVVVVEVVVVVDVEVLAGLFT